MGSATSRVSRAASATTDSAARKYPNRPMNSTAANTTIFNPADAAAAPSRSQPSLRPAAEHSPPVTSNSRDASINIDASDPDFARSLRSIGPVRRFPTVSSTSPIKSLAQNRALGPLPRLNPALVIIEARAKLQEAAELESQLIGTKDFVGREYLDAGTIRQILIKRDEHELSAEKIEQQMGLKPGVVTRLGPKGVFSIPHKRGRAEKSVEVV